MNARAGVMAVAVILGAGCASGGPLSLAQLEAGEQVRATFLPPAEDVVLSRLVRQVNGSIEVAALGEAPQRIHLMDIGLLEVTRGQDRPRAALVGSAIGGLGGLIAGMACLAACAETERGKRILAPVVGFAAGALVGGIVGVVRAPVKWIPVRIR